MIHHYQEINVHVVLQRRIWTSELVCEFFSKMVNIDSFSHADSLLQWNSKIHDRNNKTLDSECFLKVCFGMLYWYFTCSYTLSPLTGFIESLTAEREQVRKIHSMSFRHLAILLFPWILRTCSLSAVSDSYSYRTERPTTVTIKPLIG
jgi:hypothetical protein